MRRTTFVPSQFDLSLAVVFRLAQQKLRSSLHGESQNRAPKWKREAKSKQSGFEVHHSSEG